MAQTDPTLKRSGVNGWVDGNISDAQKIDLKQKESSYLYWNKRMKRFSIATKELIQLHLLPWALWLNTLSVLSFCS